MKSKIHFMLLCASSIFLIVACQKEKADDIEQLSELTKEVISKPSLQEMRQGQYMLSSIEREQLWNTKLNFILSNRKESFTKEQREIVISLQSFLKTHGMATLLKNPQLGLQFMEENLPHFIKHFNKEQLNILIESPYLSNTLVISDLNEAQLTSIALSGGNYCTCIYDLGCPGSGNFCDVKTCYVDDDEEMCGLFGTSSCKRRCSDLQPG